MAHGTVNQIAIRKSGHATLTFTGVERLSLSMLDAFSVECAQHDVPSGSTVEIVQVQGGFRFDATWGIEASE